MKDQDEQSLRQLGWEWGSGLSIALANFSEAVQENVHDSFQPWKL